MSANIGAETLHQICREVENRPAEALLPQLYDQLQHVIDEIKRNLATETDDEGVSGEMIDDEVFAEKIDTLKIALSRRRSRECAPIIEELKQYRLAPAQRERLGGLERLVKARDFKAAIVLLEGDDGAKTNHSGG